MIDRVVDRFSVQSLGVNVDVPSAFPPGKEPVRAREKLSATAEVGHATTTFVLSVSRTMVE
ncbi:MAG: hypothetical protein MJ070_11205 [Lachnospiraceae bacterium]|nr:hypothetical protein [Lachnospiraceae bacterium]